MAKRKKERKIQQKREKSASPEKKGCDRDADHAQKIEKGYPKGAPGVFKGVSHPDEKPKVNKQEERLQRRITSSQEHFWNEYVRDKTPDFSMEDSFGDQEKRKDVARLKKMQQIDQAVQHRDHLHQARNAQKSRRALLTS